LVLCADYRLVIEEKGSAFVLSLYVGNLQLYDYREALCPPTCFVPLEEEQDEEATSRGWLRALTASSLGGSRSAKGSTYARLPANDFPAAIAREFCRN
jgi:hypothetical protein